MTKRTCQECGKTVSQYNPPMMGRDLCWAHRPDTGLCACCGGPLFDEDYPRRRTDRVWCSPSCRGRVEVKW